MVMMAFLFMLPRFLKQFLLVYVDASHGILAFIGQALLEMFENNCRIHVYEDSYINIVCKDQELK